MQFADVAVDGEHQFSLFGNIPVQAMLIRPHLRRRAMDYIHSNLAVSELRSNSVEKLAAIAPPPVVYDTVMKDQLKQWRTYCWV